MKNIVLDEYEKEIEEAIEKGEYQSVENVEEEIKRYTSYFKNSVKKDKTITLRIAKQDLDAFQKKSEENGLPYQTLITAFIRQYITGKIKLEF